MAVLITGIDREVSTWRHGDAWLCFADEEIEYMLPNDEVCPSCIS
jgi:hypothetical protein